MPLVDSIQFYSKWTSNLKYYFIDKIKILVNHYIVEKLKKIPKYFKNHNKNIRSQHNIGINKIYITVWTHVFKVDNYCGLTYGDGPNMFMDAHEEGVWW